MRWHRDTALPPTAAAAAAAGARSVPGFEAYGFTRARVLGGRGGEGEIDCGADLPGCLDVFLHPAHHSARREGGGGLFVRERRRQVSRNSYISLRSAVLLVPACRAPPPRRILSASTAVGTHSGRPHVRISPCEWAAQSGAGTPHGCVLVGRTQRETRRRRRQDGDKTETRRRRRWRRRRLSAEQRGVFCGADVELAASLRCSIGKAEPNAESFFIFVWMCVFVARIGQSQVAAPTPNGRAWRSARG